MTRLVLVAILGVVACSSSNAGTGGDAGLPDSFGDCGAAVCEVGLAAFTKDAGSIPYCPPDRASFDLSCSANPGLHGATCANLWTVRNVYGFPGDFYQCVYDTGSGALVGAKWAPDSHPVQIAGTQPPLSCSPEPLCADAGSGDAATD